MSMWSADNNHIPLALAYTRTLGRVLLGSLFPFAAPQRVALPSLIADRFLGASHAIFLASSRRTALRLFRSSPDSSRHCMLSLASLPLRIPKCTVHTPSLRSTRTRTRRLGRDHIACTYQLLFRSKVFLFQGGARPQKSHSSPGHPAGRKVGVSMDPPQLLLHGLGHQLVPNNPLFLLALLRSGLVPTTLPLAPSHVLQAIRSPSSPP